MKEKHCETEKSISLRQALHSFNKVAQENKQYSLLEILIIVVLLALLDKYKEEYRNKIQSK